MCDMFFLLLSLGVALGQTVGQACGPTTSCNFGLACNYGGTGQWVPTATNPTGTCQNPNGTICEGLAGFQCPNQWWCDVTAPAGTADASGTCAECIPPPCAAIRCPAGQQSTPQFNSKGCQTCPCCGDGSVCLPATCGGPDDVKCPAEWWCNLTNSQANALGTCSICERLPCFFLSPDMCPVDAPPAVAYNSVGCPTCDCCQNTNGECVTVCMSNADCENGMACWSGTAWVAANNTSTRGTCVYPNTTTPTCENNAVCPSDWWCNVSNSGTNSAGSCAECRKSKCKALVCPAGSTATAQQDSNGCPLCPCCLNSAGACVNALIKCGKNKVKTPGKCPVGFACNILATNGNRFCSPRVCDKNRTCFDGSIVTQNSTTCKFPKCPTPCNSTTACGFGLRCNGVCKRKRKVISICQPAGILTRNPNTLPQCKK